MGFSRQEYWSGLLCSLPGDLPDPGTETASLVAPALQADALLSEPQGKPMVTEKGVKLLALLSNDVSKR